MSAPNSANAPIDAMFVAKRALRYIGVNTLDGTAAPEILQAGDLDEVAACINGAMQEIWDAAPAESKTQPSGIQFRAPTQVTVSVTPYSTAITVTGWAAWMIGCTVRITGDDQDNEIVNQTTLAMPFSGPNAGSVSATVYNDCIQLPTNVSGILGPVLLQNFRSLHPCDTQEEFIRFAGAPAVTDSGGHSASWLFFSFRKIIGIPLAWFVQGAIDFSSAYTNRRLRIAPMPDSNYKLSYRVTMNPPIYSSADLTSAGVTFPLPNAWVESILLPIVLQRFTGSAAFKNEAARVEIGRQYKQALSILANTRGQRTTKRAGYL